MLEEVAIEMQLHRDTKFSGSGEFLLVGFSGCPGAAGLAQTLADTFTSQPAIRVILNQTLLQKSSALYHN